MSSSQWETLPRLTTGSLTEPQAIAPLTVSVQEGGTGGGGGGGSESGPRRAFPQMAQTLNVPVRLNGPTLAMQGWRFYHSSCLLELHIAYLLKKSSGT